LGQSAPCELSANECEARAVDRLANYETLTVEEKLDALKDVRDLLLIADTKRWGESEAFPAPRHEH
jgi:hypothetical protein